MRLMLTMFAMLLAGTPALCRASLVASEQFSYGGASGALAGKNGGTGFTGAWTDNFDDTPWSYTAAGLTFGSLPVAGGAATWSTLGAEFLGSAHRPLAVTPSGTIYGSHLFRINSRTNTSNTAAIMLGQPFDNDIGGTFVVNTPQFFANFTDVAAVRSENQEFEAAGQELAVGETYLALYTYETSSAVMSAWILTAGQYANFIAGGLTEGELNAAALGTGATDVFERITGVDSPTSPSPFSHLLLYGAWSGLDVTLDELRVSDFSISEVVPNPIASAPAAVPEPTTGVLLVGATALLVARRRRRL